MGLVLWIIKKQKVLIPKHFVSLSKQHAGETNSSAINSGFCAWQKILLCLAEDSPVLAVPSAFLTELQTTIN